MLIPYTLHPGWVVNPNSSNPGADLMTRVPRRQGWIPYCRIGGNLPLQNGRLPVINKKKGKSVTKEYGAEM
jgi:hypothetical protein